MRTPPLFYAVAVAALLTLPAAASAQPTPPRAAADCDRTADDPSLPAPDRIKALNTCVDALEIAGEFRRGIVVFERIVAVARAAGDRRQEAESLVGMGSFYRELSEYDRAEPPIREGLALFQSLGDVAEEGDGWTALGRLHTQKGDYAAAREHHLRALDCYTRAQHPLGIAIGSNNVGMNYRTTGDLTAALPYLEASLTALRGLNDRRRSATVLDNIASIRRDIGDTDGSLEYLRQALAIREEFNDRPGIGKSRDSIATTYKVRGDYAAALDWSHRSLELRRELGPPQPIAESLNNTADIYSRLGAYRTAAQLLDEALALSRQLQKPSLQAEVLTNLAEALFLDGQRTRAFDTIGQALAIGWDHDYGTSISYANLVLGRMYLAAGQPANAVAPLDSALRFYETGGDRVGQADVLVALAEATRASGAPARALDYASRAQALGASIGMPDVQWRASVALGRLAAGRSDASAARGHFTDAIAAIEALREQTPGNPRSLAGFLESRLDPYHERLALAARVGRADDAFADAERSKARALIDIVGAEAGTASPPSTYTAEERAREVELRSALSSLNAELLVLAQSTAPDAARVATLTRRRAELRAQYDALLERIYAERPDLRVRRGVVTPASADEARRLSAARNATILEFTVSRQRVWAFVVSPTRLRAVVLPATAARLSALVVRMREQIQNRDLRLAASARETFDALLGPVAAYLPDGRDLIVVPDGFLWDLPFQALRTPDGRYLIEGHAVSYAPSITALLRLDAAPRHTPQASGLLAVGNPTLPSPGNAQPRRMTLMDGRLEPLPDAEAQVQQIAPLYPSRIVLVGPDAKETTWKAEAPRHRVLHMATHGVLDDASPMHSFLLLSQAARDAGEDGLLEAWEVMNLPLRADVVVLSACETARGRVSSGEGVTGLMWSFFVAGAPTLVVSQWKVESASSTAQMVAFHRAWRGGATGVSKGRAAQQSMLALLKTPEYAHPFYWAGYIVAGDAR